MVLGLGGGIGFTFLSPGCLERLSHLDVGGAVMEVSQDSATVMDHFGLRSQYIIQ